MADRVRTARSRAPSSSAMRRPAYRSGPAALASSAGAGEAAGRRARVELAKVIIAPHIGGATREDLRRGAEMTAAAVSQLLAGEEPDYLINPGYRQRKAAVS